MVRFGLGEVGKGKLSASSGTAPVVPRPSLGRSNGRNVDFLCQFPMPSPGKVRVEAGAATDSEHMYMLFHRHLDTATYSRGYIPSLSEFQD